MTYVCQDRLIGIDFACYATRTGGNNFVLYINENIPPDPPNAPCCDRFSGIACPTLPICPAAVYL